MLCGYNIINTIAKIVFFCKNGSGNDEKNDNLTLFCCILGFFAYLCTKYYKKPKTMGVVDWFKNDLSAEERTLTRDLLSVAVADKEFSEEEKKTILRVCQLEGISNTELMDSIRQQPTEKKLLDTLEDKKRYLLHLIRMMMSDGKYYAIELHVIDVIASRIGITPMQLLSFILDEVNAGHISREEGITVIDHLVRRFLD